MSSHGNHCSFVLLAEFHILEGAQLKYQFPQPLGIDEGILAASMLPDGAETQSDDWTVFFLNQTAANTISPILALDSPETKSVNLPGEEDNVGGHRASDQSGESKEDLLCVLNLVRTKLDKSEKRGGRTMALAICTRHPFIQIFKPVLLMALDDYLLNPSQDCLARLFDAVNSMDLSHAPKLSRHEKLVMRASERKDIFGEKFMKSNNWNQSSSSGGFGLGPPPTDANTGKLMPNHRSNNSAESYSSFEEGIMMRTGGKERPEKDRDDANRMKDWDGFGTQNRERADTDGSQASGSYSQHRPQNGQYSPSNSSFSLGGSAVWVGDESGLNINVHEDAETASITSLAQSGTLVGGYSSSQHQSQASRSRRSTDASSSSSHLAKDNQSTYRPSMGMIPSFEAQLRPGITKDTHFFHTHVAYQDHQLPIKMPLSTFPEEVGDYSIITLIKVFNSHPNVTGPHHPHLHTNGPQTHPIIILFNALVTGKRIMFLGHKRPAGEVSTFVLSACALGSGCGSVLRGFVERAFPYASLNNRDEWENVPAYIAGVTNPIFATSGAWDLLLDISSGSVTVAKDIFTTYPVSSLVGIGNPLLSRSSTIRTDTSLEGDTSKSDFVSKLDNNVDNMFIDDMKTAIEYHYGENHIRVRFSEYVWRFVRLASKYEEEITGQTKIGFPSSPFMEVSTNGMPQLGRGLAFSDEAAGTKELLANAHRIEAFRKTNSYKYWVIDFNKAQSSNPIKGFDVLHQIYRLRYAKRMSDTEVITIMRVISENVKSYEQVVELLSYLVPHYGGLMHLAYGLFHQKEIIRELTVDLFDQLRAYSVGVMFLQSLNHFQRYAYVRQAHAREMRMSQKPSAVDSFPGPGPVQTVAQPVAITSRSYSNSIIQPYANGGS